ncbi:MAG: hypothetical protein ACLQPV_00425 [Vulcanimicrobiaceae bacterium]
MIASIVIIAVGIANLWIARHFKATWLSRGSLLLALCGVMLLAISAFHIGAKWPAFFLLLGMLGVAMACMLVSIVKREIRVSINS